MESATKVNRPKQTEEKEMRKRPLLKTFPRPSLVTTFPISGEMMKSAR